MSVNTSVLTDTAKSVTSMTVRGYGDGVAAHLGDDWSAHTQANIHAVAVLDGGGDTVSAFTLRILGTRDNAGTPENVALAVPINTTGSTAVSGLPPIIVRNPDDVTSGLGTSVQFFVTAISANPLSYQWQKNDTTINGAVAIQLVLPSIQASDAGRYRCVVTNSTGTTVSSNGTLAVGAGPGTGFDISFWPLGGPWG